MKEIKLTRGKVAIVDDEDFEYLNQWKWCFDGNGYAARKEYNKSKSVTVLMHREILKTPKGMLSDHINHNGLDNRRCNLRICNYFQNAANRPRDCDNKSGRKGVYRVNNKWCTSIRYNNKYIWIGQFDNLDDATLAYTQKAKELFGEFAYNGE